MLTLTIRKGLRNPRHLRARVIPLAVGGFFSAALLAGGPGFFVRGSPGATLAPRIDRGPLRSGDRVLFIGNSLTAGNDLPLLVEALSVAGGRPLSVAWVVYGGVNLEDHWSRKTQDRITGSNWKYVVLQQGPSSLAEGRADLRKWTGRFDTVIRQAGGTTALYMVWPESRRRAVFPMVAESYRLAARDVGGVLLPAGEAWLAAWRRKPSLALYGPDGFHPTPAGSYLAALAIYAGLTGGSPVGLPGRLVLRNGATVLVDDDIAILQAAAEEAVGKSRNESSDGPDLSEASARVGSLMPARKSSRAPSTSPTGRMMLMLEEIRAQNAATIDAVHALGRELRADISRLETRVSTLEAAFRYLSGEVTALKAEVGGLRSEVGALKAEVAALKTEVFTLKGAMERVEGKVDSKADRARIEALERRVEALESART
jgi:polyhydroxyalkanoate synthesis regulator phasin